MAVDEEFANGLQIPSTSYREAFSPRLSSEGTSSRPVNLRRRKIEIEIVEGAPRGPTWQFPGSGSSQHVQVPHDELVEIQKELQEPRKLLGQLPATAISVNGVYTYAFLGLMALFSCACMLLKGKRSEIPTDIHAPWAVVVLGFLLVVIAIFANLLGDPSVLMYFALYFIVVALVIFVMFERVMILRSVLVILKNLAPSRYGKAAAIGLATHQSAQVEHTGARGGHTIARTIVSIRSAPIVFFCKTPDLTILNKAIIYVRRNEQTQNLRIVHVFADEEEDGPVFNAFREMAALFDSMYPKIRVDFVSVHGEFGPAMIEWLSRKMNVPRNMMFITQPDFLSAERVSTAGVRVITA
ncbi:uncharacterized protein KRP23_10057 [Phytophthora ramorum]|uniref:uncharacterized protein n=1 Tax=Phytophthora ramorum TaxID=164328 RepID=UPI0030A865B0|nr:hypothetical protein KRP23_10057 [Phytophthora ramorum]